MPRKLQKASAEPAKAIGDRAKRAKPSEVVDSDSDLELDASFKASGSNKTASRRLCYEPGSRYLLGLSIRLMHYQTAFFPVESIQYGFF